MLIKRCGVFDVDGHYSQCISYTSVSNAAKYNMISN